jgi:transposase-like protein
MSENINVVPLRLPNEVDDPLTNILRSGARQLLAQAVEMEAEAFLLAMKGLKLPDGRDRLVRHGHGPERTIQTGIGPVEVERVKIRDRAAAEDGERIRFTSAILPVWARRTKSLDTLLPVLYLRGISTGDFKEALAALLGQNAPNLSPAVISRLTAEWQGEYERWQKRDLSARRYVYVWADGVFLQARMEDHGECMLVLIGATPEGKKELIGFQVGVRESAQSWRELLVEVKSRGLTIAPEIAVGDGALGFWKALDEVFPGTRHQRWWVHKTANVLNKSHTLGADHMKKDLLLDRRLPLEMFPSISLHLDVAALSHRSADEFGGRVTDSGCAHGPCRVNDITRCNHGHNEALGPGKTADCLRLCPVKRSYFVRGACVTE